MTTNNGTNGHHGNGSEDARLNRMLAASPAVLYSLSYKDGAVSPTWVSENIARFMGYSPDEVSFEWWSANVHQDDREAALARLTTIPRLGELVHEYRFRHRDGSYHWVRDEQRGLRDENGAVVEIVGAWMDITEQKRLEHEVAQASVETVLLLAAAAEAHDHVTGEHFQRVRGLTEALAQELGYAAEEARELGLAAVLHDVGKIRVPRDILGKPGRLSECEWEVMKQHSLWGRELLVGRSHMELASIIALHHHERWDGTGYPDGLAGRDIPHPAAIVCVADAFDAMTSERPYSHARTADDAMQEIIACSGKQFSPCVVEAMVALHKRGELPDCAELRELVAA